MAESIFLTKAKRNVQASQLLFDNQMYDESANRAYYAAFQAALAALSTLRIQVEGMSHEATQSKFNEEFVHRRKIYPNHLKSYLSELLGVRNSADYKAKFTSKKAALLQLKKAKEFVAKVEREISL